MRIAEITTTTPTKTEKPSSAIMCAIASDGPSSMTTLHCFVRKNAEAVNPIMPISRAGS